MNNAVMLDVKGLKCPLPILKAKKTLSQLNAGVVLTVLATDAGAPEDFEAFCRHTGHEFISLNEHEESGVIVYTIVLKHK